MSEYVKQNFQPGQVLKASQLNHIEEGIAKILPVIEAGEAKQLVTDTEGNLLWEKKVLDYTIEDMVLFSNIEVTGTGIFPIESNDIGPFLVPEVGAPAVVIWNGVQYETTVVESQPRGFMIRITVNSKNLAIGFDLPGTTVNIFNYTGTTGTISSVTVKAKKYEEIDTNYIPNPAVNRNGYHSINLTGYESGTANGLYAVVAQNGRAEGMCSFSANYGQANNNYTFANGFNTKANGLYSHAEGFNTIASGTQQHTEGIYNIEDTEEKYAHIVGNGYWDDGSNAPIRSNAYTLDWQGNAWFAGSIEGTSIILSSPDGSRFNITVNNDGQLQATKI